MSTDQISKHVPFRRSVPWSEAWSVPRCVDPSVHLGWSPPSSHRDPKQRPNLSCGLHWASSLPGGWDPPFAFVQKLSYPFHSNKLYLPLKWFKMIQNIVIFHESNGFSGESNPRSSHSFSFRLGCLGSETSPPPCPARCRSLPRHELRRPHDRSRPAWPHWKRSSGKDAQRGRTKRGPNKMSHPISGLGKVAPSIGRSLHSGYGLKHIEMYWNPGLSHQEY